jgi:hypothetical protein
MTDAEYLEEINKQRIERDRQMVVQPRNWLALAGLFWLREGDNWLGCSGCGKVTTGWARRKSTCRVCPRRPG